MISDNILINSKKIIVNLIFLALLVSLIININQNFPYYYDPQTRILTYILCSIGAVFYIHGLVLLPILRHERENYKKNVSILYLTYTLFLLFFYIYNHDYLIGSIFSNHGSFIRKTSRTLILSAAPLLITMLLSYLYSAILLGRKVLLAFLELVVNLIVVSLLYAIAAGVDETSIFLLTTVLIVFYAHVFYVAPIKIIRNDTKTYWLSIAGLSTFYLIAMLSVFINNITRSRSLDVTLGVFFNLFGVLCLIYILSFVYSHIRIKLKVREKVFTLKLGAKESELRLLKSQVNPHFLFNTLNTLYATALEEKASKTAESTAKLASLIRYMQEDIDKNFIPLENEIKYLQDYIAIQKLRCAVEPEIKTKFMNIKDQIISPGLFIPFLENAFKYGIDPSKASKLSVSVICDENSINFKCVNSFNESFKAYYKEQGFGIGINNAKQRLALVYPKKHTFEVVKKENTFSVTISINTKNI